VIPRCQIELDVFSGMPNPSWSLTDSQAATFVQRLAALPEAPPGELAGHLGYRGFVVHLTQGPSMEIIRVQRGAVFISTGIAELHARDANRGLERWLLDTGRAQLPSEVLRAVENDLS
jgi:hypothetical protein